MFPTEFEFVLPKGYLDGEGNLHRHGLMRLATAADEVMPLRDPRVKANPAYATVIILSRVITQLGVLEDVTPVVIEGLFACDLNYLYQFYRQINELETELSSSTVDEPMIESFNSAIPTETAQLEVG
ncbi:MULTISPECIES: hypothetical protein [unclassified Leptolyngbya]|uniref:hypothetical protein n=1 Tax=unclassified Leptolyngbya TaxID=2650499 RepID=UPI00168544EA|nr:MULTISPECIES: hypothetical protein [unclassified Leptolyngbya]MBD1909753.1 hypothetical protein [Leptolyngbya sp. FACHB-8]MBD2157651.1 hypothetical protein [Leptolyngbya sp. FACHB-16]